MLCLKKKRGFVSFGMEVPEVIETMTKLWVMTGGKPDALLSIAVRKCEAPTTFIKTGPPSEIPKDTQGEGISVKETAEPKSTTSQTFIADATSRPIRLAKKRYADRSSADIPLKNKSKPYGFTPRMRPKTRLNICLQKL
jgi:hypothetical protein